MKFVKMSLLASTKEEDAKCQTVAVKKMRQVLDEEEKKILYKEVRLKGLKGISFHGCDGLRVHSLSDFLLQIGEFNCAWRTLWISQSFS